MVGVGVAPVASRGSELVGDVRKIAMGHSFAWFCLCSNEGSTPRRVVWSVGLAAGRNYVSNEWRQRWDSGPRRDRATGVDEVGKRHGRPRRALLSMSPCSGEHGNDGGQLLGGAELGHGGALATVAQEARGARGGEAGLTGRHTRWPLEV